MMFGVTMFSSSAFAATTKILDNDALSNAPGYNDMSGSWVYKTGSGYNGDYRLISGSRLGAGSGAGYSWIFNVKNKSATHSVYLNNAGFTSPKTAYQIDFNTTGVVFINQNTAPGGWNNLGKNKSDSNPSAIIINGAMSSSKGSVGADATKIVY